MSIDAVQCLDTCQKYNRAQAPIFSDQEEMTEMVTWALNTTTDPLTNTLHEGVQYSATFWLPIRFEQVSTLIVSSPL